MIIKLAKYIFYVECLFLLLLVLTLVPVSDSGRSLIEPNPALVTFTVFFGYWWLALGFVFYILLAFIAAMGKPYIFWHSYTPLILGLPIEIWGFGKLRDSTSLFVAIFFLLGTILLSSAIAMRTQATHWRVLPGLLLACFIVTVDLTEAAWANVFIGSILFIVPIFLRLQQKEGVTS